MTDQAEQLDVLQAIETLGVAFARDAGLEAAVSELWLNESAWNHVVERIVAKAPHMVEKPRTAGMSIVFKICGHEVIVRLDK